MLIKVDHLSFLQISLPCPLQQLPSFIDIGGECCKNSNLDCGIDLCFGSHNEKADENRFDSLHYSTDFKYYFV